MSELAPAAAQAADCLGVRAGERVAVIYNSPQTSVAEAFAAAARARGAEVELVGFAELDRHGAEPPDAVAAAMLGADAVFAATMTSLSHTGARRVATERGVRVASLPTVTDAIFARTMAVDFAAMSRDGARIAELLTRAESCRITSAAGTDVTLSLHGRQGRNDDGDLRARGAFGNLPAGEGYIAPREDAGEGAIVFDGSLAGWGLLDEPLAVRVEGGAVTSAAGPAGDWLLTTLDAGGPNGRRFAELAIGTNPAAILTGVVLEDEKVRGTAHVAFGASTGIGGTNDATVHIDGVLWRPTIELDGTTVVYDGQLV
jgi:leucyl aminopeptidase (aminopeptidase T)